MLIKSLEIQGFKSFPDKTVLSFENGITAVVGPNGSGKSNISDAVRWVLGEQSTKSLRGTKMEDVIFNGTENRKAQGYAEVSLCIDNADRRLAFDNDELKITRRYYRSGESEYKVNGTAVRLRDINELFMDTGLGRDGYSIISQGKIADIVSTRSEDRREVFEEAAGISKYRYRKVEAERRLQQAQENLERLRDILTELERQVGPLAIQAEKAKKYLEYASEKKEIEIGLWVKNLNQLTLVLRAQEEKLGVIRGQYDAANGASEKIEQELNEISAQTAQIAVEIDQIRRAASENEQEATQKDGQAAVLENDIHHHEENILRLQQEQKLSATSEQEIQTEIEQKLAAAAQSDLRAQEQRAALAQSGAEMSGILQALAATDASERQCTEKLETLRAAQNAAATAEANAGTAVAEIGRRMEAAEEERKNARQRTTELEGERTQLKTTLDALTQQISALKNTVQGHTLLVESQRKRAAERKNDEEQLRLDMEAQRRRTTMLEEMERSFEGFAHSVKIVMKEAEHSNLSGIHGPVSRIMQVPARYTVAIETALGGALQNIVCSNENDAKRAIALLKQRDAGRATFLPLTSVRGSLLAERGLEDCFGFVGIAAELVSYDKQYEGICRSLLGRVAVAEDLDSAIAIARSFGYRFRIVTLDGQLVNAGGSLTGGSLSKNAGLMSRQAEIEKSKANETSLRQKLAAASEQLKTVRESLSAEEAALSGAQGELMTAQEDQIRAQADWNRVCSLLENSAKGEEALQTERREAERRVAELQEAQRTAHAQTEECAAQAAQQEAARDVVRQEREAKNARRETLLAENSGIQTNIVAAEKDGDALRNAAEVLRRRIGDQQQHADELARQEQEYARQIEQLRVQITALKEEADSLRRSAGGAEEKVRKQTELRLTLETRTTQLRQQEREKSTERENCAQEIARLEEQKSASQKSYDDIIKSLWDEYELSPRAAEESAQPVEDVLQSQRRLAELKSKIRGLGTVNLDAIESYKEVSERYEFLKTQVQDAEGARAQLQELITRLTAEMRKIFTERFAEINRCFSETFRDLFGGGTGNLSLDDPDDVLNSGIRITVQPQGKIITNVDALSGGEKSLAAIALYFAIGKVSPPPFCILDEIEAALDDVNVTRFAEYLRRMTDHTQYIVITHRRGTMEEADVLYGVTMQEKGVSKLLQMHMNEVEKIGIQ